MPDMEAGRFVRTELCFNMTISAAIAGAASSYCCLCACLLARLSAECRLPL